MIEIKDKSGKLRYRAEINTGSIRKFRLMTEDYILLKFSVDDPVYFQLGDYAEYDNELFEIVDLVYPSLNKSTGGYDYELRLDASYWKWKNKILFYNRQGNKEATWNLTRTPDAHLAAIISNLSDLQYTYNGEPYEPSIDWNVIEKKPVFIQYSNANIIDALTQIAEACECEWWVIGKTIYLGRCELTMDEPVTFELGTNVNEMSRDKSDSTYATRIYAFGSTRNITPYYRKNLIFKATKVESDNGVYVMDENRPLKPSYFLDDRAFSFDYKTDAKGSVRTDELTERMYQTIFPVSWELGDMPMGIYNVNLSAITLTLHIWNVLADLTIKVYLASSFDTGSNSGLLQSVDVGEFTGVPDRFSDITIPLKSVTFDTSGYNALNTRFSLCIDIKVNRQNEGELNGSSLIFAYTSGNIAFSIVSPKYNISVIPLSGVNAGKELSGVFNPYGKDEKSEDYQYIKLDADGDIGLDHTFKIKGLKYQNVPLSYFTSDHSDSDIVVESLVEKRLCLPKGKEFIGDDLPVDKVIEQVVVFEDVYPKRTGHIATVTSHPYTEQKQDENGNVISEEEWNAYRITDTDENFHFSKDYIISEKDLKITFQTGALAGMQFVVWFNPYDENSDDIKQNEKKPNGDWNPNAQVFEIVCNENYGRKLPADDMKPRMIEFDESGNIIYEGDEYILEGYDTQFISDSFVPQAELELQEKAQKYADKLKIDPSVYNCNMFSYKDDRYSNLQIGHKINLLNPTYFEDGRVSRIIGFEKKLDIPYDSPVYIVGESQTYSRIGTLENKINALTFKGQTYTNSVSGGSNVYVISRYSNVSPSDANVFSASRALLEHLSKKNDDEASGLITFLGGLLSDSILSRKFTSGILGSGLGLFIDKNGKSILEVDNLLVRMKAVFHELIIEKLSHVGGEIVLSPASMRCIKVEELEDAYRCYFKGMDDDKVIHNEFALNDQARCQTFNVRAGTHQNISNQYYWRLVVGVGDDYIDLSKTDCDTGSDIPQAGDDIVQLGNRDPEQEERQNAIILSSYGPDAPSIKQYMSIDHYTLEGKECTVVSPHGNVFTGDFNLKTGVSITTQLQVLENLIKTEIQNIEYIINNTDNYLTNASFTADLDDWVTGSNVSIYEDNSSLLAVNEKLYAANESFTGLASYNGKYMLRIKNGFIKQLAGNIEKPNNAGVFYVSFKYYCTEAGTLSCGFKNQELYNEIEITESRTPKMHEFSGIWNGTGDFILEFSGEMYISLLSLTNRPLDEFKEETCSAIEQTNELIKTEIAKVTKSLENYSTIEQTSEHIKSEVSSFQQGIENLVQNSECTTSDVGSWVGNPYVKGCTNMTVPKTVEIGLDRSTKLLDTNYYLSFKFINNNLSAYIYLSGDSKMNYKCLTLSFDYFITSLYPRNATLDTAFGVTVESDGMLYGSIFSKPLSVIMGTWAHASFTLDYRDNDSITINNAMLLRCNAETATILVRNISLREVYCDLPYSPSATDLATKSIVEQTAKSWSAKILNGQDNIIAAINMDRSGTHMLGVVSFESFTANFKEAYLQAFGNASMTAKDDVARQLGFSNYQQLAENAATQGKAVLIGGYLNLELIDVKTLLAGDIISEMISSNGINIAGKFFFNKDSKALTFGNLKVLESGALAGGNAIFDDIGKFSMWPSGTPFENLNFESFIIDRIDKMTTIVLAPCEMGVIDIDKTFDVYLPDRKDLIDKNIDISYGFRLTIIASGKLLDNYAETEVTRVRYNIKCRSEERYTAPSPGFDRPITLSSKTYIRDNDYKVIDSIGMARGDVLELYFCYGDYYFVNRSN